MWAELSHNFAKTFQATYKRPASVEELRACTQKPRESIRSYVSRWTIIRNAAEGISEERAIDAFIYGLRRVELKEELGRVKPTSTAHLMEIANRWADGEDSLHTNHARSYDDDADARYTEDPDRRHDHDRRRKRKSRSYDAADGTEMMAAGFAKKRDSDNRVTSSRPPKPPPRTTTCLVIGLAR